MWIQGTHGFDWDRGNQRKILLKHGLGREEVERFFLRGVDVFPDERHSDREERLVAVGTSDDGHPMIAVFVLRISGQGLLIRPVSARLMHRKEALAYEKNKEENRSRG